MEQTIGKGFVEVATKGLEKVQAELDSLRKTISKATGTRDIDKATQSVGFFGGAANVAMIGFQAGLKKANEMAKALGNTLENVGKIAKVAFVGGIGAIAGFVRMASPRGWDDLTVALAKVSIQLGTIFVPILRQVTALVNRLETYLRSLSNAQRTSILNWVKTGLVIAGVLALLPRIIAGIRLVSTAVQAFGVSAAVATGGLTLLLAAAAAVLPLLMGLFQGGGNGGGFGELAAGLQQLLSVVQAVFGAIFGIVRDTFARLAPVIQRAFAALVPIIEAVFARLVPLIERIMPIIERVFTSMFEWFTIFANTITSVLDPIFSILSNVVDLVEAILVPVLDIMTRYLEAMAPVIAAFIRIVSVIVDLLTTLLVPIIELFGVVLEAAMALLQPILEAFAQILEAIVGLLADLLRPAIQALAESIRAAVAGIRATINGLISVLNGFINWYNRQRWLPGRIQNIRYLSERTQRPTPPRQAGSGSTPRPEEDHRGSMRVPQAQLVGFAEMWRKFQTAQIDDPNTQIFQAQLAATQQTNQTLSQINQNIQPNQGWGTTNPAADTTASVAGSSW